VIPYINETEAAAALGEPTAFRLAEETFRLLAAGRVRMPAKMYLTLAGGDDFRAMPAAYSSPKGSAAGIKWVSVHPKNPARGLPTVNGTILLNSAETGELLAVVAANGITALRTAAAAAVAAKHLANPNPVRLAIVGAGLQARYQLRALEAIFRFQSASVWGFLPGEAERFCGKYGSASLRLTPARDVRRCVEDADIVVTCTPSRRPLVRKAWIKAGAHVNAIGADAQGKEELEPALVLSSKVVVDDWEQASHSGEINVPVARGLFKRHDLKADLAQVVAGKKKVRTRPSDVTIFDSTGIAALDLYFARYVYDARSRR